MDEDTRDGVQKRLKRISGQVGGVQRMVEEGRYCIDVLNQVAAIRAALAKVAGVMLESHVRTCVAEAFSAGSEAEQDKKIAELVQTMTRTTGGR